MAEKSRRRPAARHTERTRWRSSTLSPPSASRRPPPPASASRSPWRRSRCPRPHGAARSAVFTVEAKQNKKARTILVRDGARPDPHARHGACVDGFSLAICFVNVSALFRASCAVAWCSARASTALAANQNPGAFSPTAPRFGANGVHPTPPPALGRPSDPPTPSHPPSFFPRQSRKQRLMNKMRKSERSRRA